MNPTRNIIRSSFLKRGEPLNILTAPTHERYETGLCQTGHNFYALRAEGIKDWNANYGKIPRNYQLLDPEKGHQQVPEEVTFDLVLSQNKFGQFQALQPFAVEMQIPLVSLEHTLPMPQWDADLRTQLANMRGDINVFISQYSLGQWGWQDYGDTTVVHHMVDTNLFKPGPNTDGDKQPQLLSVVNDWINRDWCCNFQGWQRITKGLPVRVVGDTPGLSKPAGSIEELVSEYQHSLIFLNTSTISPIPTSMLEAMACGCAVVSLDNCMIPEIIEHGKNGFISNDEAELRKYCELLLNDVNLATELGANAVETIRSRFSSESFVDNWNRIFYNVVGL